MAGRAAGAAPGSKGSRPAIPLPKLSGRLQCGTICCLAGWADREVQHSFAKRGVARSEKGVAFGPRWEVTGGEFTFDPRPGQLAMRPRAEAREAHARICERTKGPEERETEGRRKVAEEDGEEARRAKMPKKNRIYVEEMESVVGLLEWCVRFAELGGLECYEPQRILHGKLRKANQSRLRKAPATMVCALRTVREAVESEYGGQGLSDPVYSHPGGAVAGGASPKVGWGGGREGYNLFGSMDPGDDRGDQAHEGAKGR